MPKGIYKRKFILRIAREVRHCICGCGESFVCKITSSKRYIQAHVNRGRAGYWTGKKRSEKTLKKMWKGRDKFLTKYGSPRKGKYHTKEAKRKISKNRLGKGMGPKYTEEMKQKMQELHLGMKNPAYGRKRLGADSNNWKGGISFDPYPIGWTDILKESIRQRDGYKCQLCDKTQKQEGRKLSVHHIDYDKDNLDPTNLISLCKVCNSKVNGNRIAWTRFFQLKLKLIKKAI